MKPAPATRTVPALDVFIARCEARAKLWQAGEIDLHDAVDALQAAAVRSGLVAEIGQDHVQAIMAEAFGSDTEKVTTFIEEGDDYDGDTFAAACRKADEKRRSEPPNPYINKRDGGAAAATLEAAEYLVRNGDTKALREWLERHTPEERRAIYQHLKAKQCRSRPQK